MRCLCLIASLFLLSACNRLHDVGVPPTFTPNDRSAESLAMSAAQPADPFYDPQPRNASLWSRGSSSLFGDRRAARMGDILTVVIEIDESAEISNETARWRTGSQTAAAPTLFGLETAIDNVLPWGTSLASGYSTNSSTTSTGDGSIKRNEKLTLRVAATVVEQLANGVLRIEGSQEVRVDYEIRELLVSGYVRPADISRKNEITYDKIASARVSYGGRGSISRLQQPPVLQQAAEQTLPY